MRCESAFALLFLFVAIFGAAQEATGSSAAAAEATSQPANKVYYAGPDVTAPEVPPIEMKIVEAPNCDQYDGTAELSAVVDADGRSHNISFTHPIGSKLDQMAYQLIQAERFKPGAQNGVPAPVAVSVKVELQACRERVKDGAGKDADHISLRSLPVQTLIVLEKPSQGAIETLGADEWNGPVYQVGPRSGVSAPVPVKTVKAVFPEEARKKGISGSCLISLIVDAKGMPQNPRVFRGLEPGLDQKAIEAVKKYRFNPAMQDGQPVAVEINIEVNFKPK